MRSIVPVLMLLVAASAPLAVSLTPATTWVVENDTTISGIPFALAQDVRVTPGAVLRFDGASVLALRDINVTVEGTLALVNGTSLASATLPFTLYVAPGGSIVADQATIAGGSLRLAGSGDLSSTSVANAAIAVLAGSTAIHGGSVTGSTADLLDVFGGSLTVERASLDGAGAAAAYVGPAGALRLANVTVGRTGDYGIRVQGGAATIENDTFALSPEYAIYAQGAAIDIVDSSFSTHCGAYLVAGSHGRVERNAFTTIDHGLTLTQAGAVRVHDDLFRGTQDALLLFQSSPDVQRSRFENNTNGVHALVGAVSAPLLRNVSFVGNGVAVRNEMTSAAVDAAGNWWGSASGPAASDISGSVTISPWLTSAP